MVPRSTTLALLAASTLVLGLAVGGCKKDKVKGAGVASGGAVEAAAYSMAALKAPAEVVAYGGTDNLDELLNKLQGFAGKVHPMAQNLTVMAVKGLQAQLLLTATTGLDLGKPMRFVVSDPKKNPHGQLLLFSSTGEKALVATLPKDHKKGLDGNAYGYSGIYLNFIDQVAVFSKDKAIFGRTKAFLGDLIKAQPTGQLAVVGAIDNVLALYGADFEKSLAEQKKMFDQLAKTNPQMQVGGIGKTLDWMTATSKELDRAVLTTNVGADGMIVSFSLKPKAGTPLEKTFNMMTGDKLSLLAKLPQDSPFFMGAKIDPDKSGDLAVKLFRWSMTMGYGGVKMPAKYGDAMATFWKATSGEFVASAFNAPEGDGLAMAGLIGIRDEGKARESFRTFMGIYEEESMKKALEVTGMKFNYKEDADKIGETQVSSIQVEMGALEKQLGPSAAFLKEMMQGRFAMTKDLWHFSYGSDSLKVLQAFLGGKIKGGLDNKAGTKRMLANAAPGSFFLMYLEPMEVAKRISIGGKNPFAAKLAGTPPAKTGVAFSMGSQNGELKMVLDVPLEQATALAQIPMLMMGMGMGR